MLEETSHRYQPLQAAALRLNTRATTEDLSSSWRPPDVSQQLQPSRGRSRSRGKEGAVRDPEDILDPRAVLTHGCLPSTLVCSKEISTRPGHPRSRAPNHR
ncbi:hypothetical protein MRX96_016850 [Rhipicephalus microplus]